MDYTEQEEQEMINRAKAGDPEANYNLSLWALEQAMAEPEEDRWNRLAAKCLVKAAEAGYAPAKERMAELLRRGKEAEAQKKPTIPAKREDAEDFDWSGESDSAAPPRSYPGQQPDSRTRAAAVVGFAAVKTGAAAKAAAGRIKNLFAGRGAQEQPDEQSNEDDHVPSAPAPSRASHASRRSILPDVSAWDDHKWKKMQLICIVVCVILALLIVLMIVTGKGKSAADEEQQLPAAATAEPVEVTPTPEPPAYPDDATRAEIEQAALDIYPEDAEYVTEATTATVSAGAGLNLRKGPGSSYSQIVLMSYNSSVDVYATKNSWALVHYNGDTWGWCSTEYLRMQ